MSPGTLLYLSRQDVESVGLPMAQIIDALEEMFRDKGRGLVEMPPKPGIHPRPDAFIHAMPAHIPRLGAAGLRPGRESSRERAISIDLGLALEDMATAIRVCDRARARGLGRELAL